MLKRLIGSFAIFFTMSCSQSLAADSSGPQVVSGTATFQQSSGNLTVTTGSNRTIITWNSFGVPAGTTTNFVQPGSNSAVLNRVLGNLPSRIDGSLLSNGRVYLINPHGIVVGANGIINTAGFVGSTLDVNDAQFLSGGEMRFTGVSNEAIVNLGRIEASDGNVFLIAARLENHGTIKAANGTVGLVAAKDVLLTGNNQVFIQPTEGFLDGTGIKNSGVIEAARAELVAQGNLYALAINNSGTVNATSVVNDGGRVLLRADGGTISNTGNLTAKRADAGGKTTGGTIEVLAEVVDLDGIAVLDASGDLGGGQINIGGNKQGQGPLPNARLTHVGEGVQIFADALEVGNGGTVIVWADGQTGYRGNIYARALGSSGDGGFVEVSGKGWLGFSGGVDASSMHGLGGTLLLDPVDVHIVASGGDSGWTFSAGAFTSDATHSNIDVTVVTGRLDTGGGGTNVSIVTGTGTGNGDIFVDTAVSWTKSSTLTLQASRDVILNANITPTGAGGIVLDAGTGAIKVNGARQLTSAGGNITLKDAVQNNGGTDSLTINAGAGAVDIQSTVGAGGTALESLTVTGGTIALQAVTTNKAQSYTGATTLNGTLTVSTAGFGVTVTGATTLAGSGGTITLSGTADAANDVSLGAVTGAGKTLSITAAGGDVSVGQIGASGTELAGVTISATGGTITLNNTVSTTGAQSYTGATTIKNSLTSTTDKIAITGAATLGGAVTITSGAGAGDDITFSSTIAGGSNTLTLNAGASGVVSIGGDATGLTSLSATGATIGVQKVTTDQLQAYTGATTLNDTLTVNNAGFGVTVTGTTTLANSGGTISLSSTSDAANDVTLGTITGAGKTLSITAAGGDVILGDAGTAAAALAGVSVQSNTLRLNGSLFTDGAGAALDFSSTNVTSVVIGGTVVIDTENGSGTAGSVTFSGASISGTGSLTIDTTGTTSAGVTLGTVSSLDSLTISASTISLQAVTTTKAQSYTGATTLNGTLTVNNAGFGVTVTGTTALAGSGGTITLSGTSDAANDVTLGTVTGSGKSLSITAAGGDVSVGQIGASGSELAGVTISATGGTITLNNTVNTTGAQSYTGATTIKNNLTSTTDKIAITGAATLGATVTLASGGGAGDNITFSSTITGGGFGLTLNAGASGAISIGGDATGLASLSATGATASVQKVTTTGAQSYTGTTTLNGDITSTTSGTIVFNNDVLLATGAIQVQSAGAAGNDITFSGKIDGGQALTVNAGSGDANFMGAVGGTSLTSLDVTGGSIDINGGSVKTTGAQTYNNNAVLSANTTLTGTDITFKGTVESPGTAYSLTVNASGTTDFQAAVGGNSNPLSFLTTDSAGTAKIGGNITTSGASGIVFNDAVTVTAALTLTANSNGAVTFAQAVSATGAGALTVTTGGTTSFQSTVGLASLKTDGGGTTALSGNVTVTGAAGIVFSDDVTLNNTGGTIALSSGGNLITLGKVDAVTDESLTVNAGAGALTLNGAIGGGTALTNVSLTTSNAAAVTLPAINATGIVTISIGGAVTQGAGTSISAATLRLEGVSFNLDKSANSVGTLQTTGTNVSGALTFVTSTTVQTGNITCGDLVIEHGGTLSLGGNITASSFRESNVGNTGGSAGGVDALVGATRTVNTSAAGGAITFKSNIVLNDHLTLNAGASGGTITLANVNDGTAGAHNLTMTGGGFTFGTLGTPNKLAQISITTNQAAGITVSATGINADTIGFTNTGGDLTVGADITAQQISLTASGVVHVNGILTATSGAATVNISGAGADQTKKIVATNLVLDGTGTFTLTDANNDVANLSTVGNTIGSISLTSIAATLNLGGIDTTGTAGSGNLTVTGSGTNNLQINGPVALLGSFNSSNFVGTTLAGSLSIGANKDLTFGGTLTISGSAALSVTGTGILTINNVAGPGADLTLNTGAGPGAGVASLHLTGTLGSTGDLGTVVINSSGPVLQDTGSGQTINAGTLDLRGTTNYTLITSVTTLHTNGGTVTGNINITNDKALTVGTSSLGASGSVSLKTTAGDITISTAASAGTTFSLDAFGAVTVNNSVTAGAASTITVKAGSGASGAGLLSGAAIDFLGSGAFSLTTSVSDLSGSLSSGSITISNNKTIDVNAITAPGGLSVTTTVGGINVKATPGSVAGNITLNANTNLIFDSGIGLTSTGTNTINLTWGGSLTTDFSNAISADTLTLSGGGAIDLTGLSVNKVGGTVSGGAGAILLTNNKALSFNNFNAGSKDVTVTTTVGGVSQGAGTAITDSGTFTVSSAGAITLTNSGNDFGAFKVTGTGGTVSVRDTNNLILGGVSAGSNILNVQTGGTLTQSGIITSGELQLNAGSTVTLNNPSNSITGLSGSASGAVGLTTTQSLLVNAFNAGANTVTLNTAGTTAGGILTAGTLDLTSSASATLSTSITNLTASVTGFLDLTEQSGLTIAAGGVSASTGMKLKLLAGNLTLTGGLTSAGATVTLDSTGGTVSGAGVISAGTLTLNGTPTSVNVTTTIANLDGTITGGGSITIANSGSALSINSLSDSGGAVTINNGANSIAVNTLNAVGGTIALTGAGITGTGLSANGLTLTSSGAVNLSTSVSTLQAAVSGAGNGLAITETDGLTVNGTGITTVNGAVAINSGSLTIGGSGIGTAGGLVSLTSSGAISVGGSGIVTAGGNVTLNAASGFTLGGNVNAGGAGTVTLHATSGGASQSGGAVTGLGLELTGAGGFTLNGANDVTNFAANVNGAIAYTDATGLTIGSAGSTNGVVTGGNNLTLATGGALNLADNVSVGGGTTTFDVSSGGVSQSAGVLTTGSLLLKDSSNTVNAAFSLGSAGNSIGTLAADIGSGTRINSTLSVNVAGSIVIGAVNGTTGIKAGQAVSISAPAGTITVNAAIVSFGSLGTPQAFVTGQVYPLDPALLGPLLQGNGTITLTAAPLPSGGGTIVFQLQPYNPNANLLGSFNLAGLGNITSNLSNDLGSLGSLGLDDNLKRDDLSSSVEKSIANIKFEKLNELMQNITQIIENQGDNESLRRSLDEVKNSEQMLLLANGALDESGGLLSRLQDGDPLKAILKELIDDVHKAGDDVKNANLTLALKISTLYGGDRLDRLAEDALEGAIVGLRNANDRLRVAALVLRLVTQKLADGKITAAQANELMELVKNTRAEETLKAAQERERRDRLAEDARFAAMQDLGNGKNGKKNEPKEVPKK